MNRGIFEIRPQVWQLEGTQMEVEVVLASVAKGCPPIFTLRMRYPRVIHSEVMTHRVFSRNARSSRAVPVKTMLDEVRSTPFVPWHWGKNQSGMQAGEECDATPILTYLWNPNTENEKLLRNTHHSPAAAWLAASEMAVHAAEAFSNAGYHKQICNRLLEPFMWIDVLVTSTEWANFLWLRDHEAAEPHLQDLARLVTAALRFAEIQTLNQGEWHLPYITDDDRIGAISLLDLAPGQRANTLQLNPLLCKLSAARCARISYKPFDGDASYERELERYNTLVGSDFVKISATDQDGIRHYQPAPSDHRVHASPLEHQATPDLFVEGHVGPWGEWRVDRYQRPELHGNFRGWIQYRKMVPGENHTSP